MDKLDTIYIVLSLICVSAVVVLSAQQRFYEGLIVALLALILVLLTVRH